ncbi:DUF5801 repeats-in-toxin domain-containing protein, partial [Halomonas salipaludis]
TGSTPDGEVLRIEIGSDGTVTVTQSAPLDHDAQGADSLTLPAGLVGVEATVTVTDGDGDTVSDTLSTDLSGNISIVDDVPGLDLSDVDLSEVSFETLDSETVDGTSVASASVAAAFTAAVDASYGADGAGSTVISDYALTLGDLDHGLTSGGEPVVFTQDASGVITGTADGTEVLRIEIGSDGTVTVTQSAALDHDAQGADSLTLPAGLVGVEATVTVTDGDGDTVTDTLGVDLSGNISIVDDVPGLDLSAVDLSEVSFETLDSETVDGTSVASASVAAAFTAAVDASYGADGAGSTVISDYALTLGDLDHGLTSGGEPLTFSLDGGVITGTADGTEVLRIEIGSDGMVTVTQSAPLDHDAQGADSLTLPAGLVGVEATVTVTDGDGDTVSDILSTDLSGNISIVDDVPGLDLSDVDLSEVSFETLDSETVDGTSVASASVAAAFTAAVDASYGADGAGSTVISDYALTLGDLDHGLTSGGEPVVFTQDASGVITGSTPDGEVLRIEIGSDGTVTVTQSAPLDHDAQGADSLTLPAGLVGVEATVTVTDGDGDTVSDTLSTDLSGNISIVDDVPGL